MNKPLYEFTVKVRAAAGSDLPSGSRGAYVPCYAFAPDHQAAVKSAVKALSAQHLMFDALEGAVRQLPLQRWSDYLLRVWPEFIDDFPNKTRMVELPSVGGAFFGPMTTF